MTYPVMKIAGKKRLSALVKREYDPEFCREPYTLAGGSGAVRPIVIGNLLSKIIADTDVTVSTLAGAGNTGDGTMALGTPAHTASVLDGDYVVTCTTGGADGVSKFRVEDPEGKNRGTATGGTEFVGHVRFTISGGGTNFAEGDTFTVTVAIADGSQSSKIVAWDPNGEGDAGRIWGLAGHDVTADDGVDRPDCWAFVNGPMVINPAHITWPAGVTDEQKADALQALHGMLIKAR